MATDLDPRFLAGYGLANLEVRRHDVAGDQLKPMSVDLIHAHAVMEHVQQREDVLARLVPAPEPGGWMVPPRVTALGRRAAH